MKSKQITCIAILELGKVIDDLPFYFVQEVSILILQDSCNLRYN